MDNSNTVYDMYLVFACIVFWECLESLWAKLFFGNVFKMMDHQNPIFSISISVGLWKTMDLCAHTNTCNHSLSLSLYTYRDIHNVHVGSPPFLNISIFASQRTHPLYANVYMCIYLHQGERLLATPKR